MVQRRDAERAPPVAWLTLDAGTTVLSGQVADQAQLHGYIARVEELGLELVSIRQTGDPSE